MLTPLPLEQMSRHEVTWLGLHAFRQVFGAYAREHPEFRSPTYAIHKASIQAGVPHEVESAEDHSCNVATAGAKRHVGCARGSKGELEKITCEPDALSLMAALTSDVLK